MRKRMTPEEEAHANFVAARYAYALKHPGDSWAEPAAERAKREVAAIRALERIEVEAEIAAWLRWAGQRSNEYSTYMEIADDIEAGEHRSKP